MKICFPVFKNEGMDSKVFGHFGSAPMFVVADTTTREVENVLNRDRNHEHGTCQPLKALGGQIYDAIIVGGIGAGALTGLNQAGLKVYQALNTTISENLDSFEKGNLTEIRFDQVCGDHGHGHGCG
jgi:predicted Fe-Mo cluster-binding NifX family protein